MGLRSLGGLILAMLLLVACDSSTPGVTETSAQTKLTLTSTSAAPNVAVTNQPILITPTQTLTLPALPTTAPTANGITTTVATIVTAEANPLADPARKFNAAQSYSFEVSQTASLQAGASISELSAQGSGLFVAGNFSQTVVLKAGGASQPVEIFVQGDKGYQKLSNLAVWRKLNNQLYKFAATEPPSILQAAINAKTLTAQVQEKVGTVLANKYSYSVAGAQLVDGQGGIGPLPLGTVIGGDYLKRFCCLRFESRPNPGDSGGLTLPPMSYSNATTAYQQCCPAQSSALSSYLCLSRFQPIKFEYTRTPQFAVT